VMEVLAKNNYEKFDFYNQVDKTTWEKRQTKLGITADGIPGPHTVDALKKQRYQDGLWMLPPISSETASGHSALETILDAFFPTFVTAVGDANKALSIISDWVKQHQ